MGKTLKRWQTAAEIKSHRKAQNKYEKSPEEVMKRENRNTARRHEIAAGKAHVGDGKDIEHKDGDALNNDPSNWRVGTRHHNRSYPRTKGAHKLYKSS